MARRCIIAIDEGTTGTRATAVDQAGRIAAQAYLPLNISYPQPGWVQQDPLELWQKTLAVTTEVYAAAREQGGLDVAGLAISNQRETAVAWHRATGRPLHPAVVWQCRRTAARCAELKAAGHEPLISARTGLPIDPYFSATKMAAMLDAVPNARSLAEAGELCLGTVDSWLLWNLTGGRVHATDATNASRTQLMDLESLTFDPELCALFDVPLSAVPQILPSSGEAGVTRNAAGLPDGIPILALIGDSQAALFGETAFAPGMAKVTYGTGSSVLVNTGGRPAAPSAGLAATVAWQIGSETTYAMEGIIHTTGAAIQWLRDQLGIITSPAETEALALSVPDTGGVCFVPAFVGLGTPWWDPDARGLLIGLTRGTGKAHIARAVLDSIAYQVHAVFTAIDRVTGRPGSVLFASGGASRNGYLMQTQADLLGRPVATCTTPEASSMGAAYLAGLAAGFWTPAELTALHEQVIDRRYHPQMAPEQVQANVAQWHRAVERSLRWHTAD